MNKEQGIEMNEINISIPYSLFKSTFKSAFTFNIAQFINGKLALTAIDTAKKYWILLDSEARADLIAICFTYLEPDEKMKEMEDFIIWAGENINAEYRKNLQRPLVDILPVVNMAKVNHKAGD